MRIASSGLAFDYAPTKEIMRKNSMIAEDYVKQEFTNFALISYYKKEKKQVTRNLEGFLNIDIRMVFEMNMLDTNPRRYIYDKSTDLVFRVSNTPINPALDPSKRRMIELDVDMVNSSEMLFDLDFIREKYKEIWEALYAAI